MNNAALLLVDLQNDFLPGGALAVPDSDAVIAVANAVQERFQIVVATQDWHPADHISFAANHPNKQPGDTLELAGCSQVLWPVHCVQNSHGAEFAKQLNRDRWCAVFQKGTDPLLDSYSGFFDNGHEKATGLAEYLRALRITQAFMMGLATDYCVKFTVLDACQLGLETFVIVDGCRGVDLVEGDSERAITEMQAAGAVCLTSAEVLRQDFKALTEDDR